MFIEYAGEFGISPAPTQLVGNYCSANCAFCFANLNSPEREADPIRISGFLRDLHKNKGQLYAEFLRQGYPCLVSNLVDPFAASNNYLMVKTMETMTELEIPIMIQTRGKFGVDDALSFLKPSNWYITINTIREELREKLEPGASSVKYRLELINTLREKGHVVTVGINPLVPQWMSYDDIDWLIPKLGELGVAGIWLGTLHFDNKQQVRLSAKERAIIGEDVIAMARKKWRTQEEDDLYQYTLNLAKDYGIGWYDCTISEYTNYWDKVFPLYPKRFPLIQEFVNWCFVNKPERPLSFADFRATLGGSMPEGVWKLREYTRSISMAIGASLPERLTFEQLLRVFWSEYTFKRSLLRQDCFALWLEDGEVQTDDEDMPYYWFNEDGWGEQKEVGADWDDLAAQIDEVEL